MHLRNLGLFVCQALVVSGIVLPDLQLFEKLEDLAQKPMLLSKPSEGGKVGDSRKVEGSPQAPLVTHAKIDDILPMRYIVVLKEDMSEQQVQEHISWATQQHEDMTDSAESNKFSFFDIDGLLKGYVGVFTDAAVEIIRAQPGVDFVEKDAIMRVNELEVEKDAPWGLTRVSHRKLSSDSSYLYDDEGGEGVVAYVVDTGIKTSLEEFEGRAKWGEAVAFPKVPVDGNGHGTHCAGIIGSKTYGIAKKVSLVAVGVMNALGAGSTSDIIKGIEFVVKDHKKNKIAKGFKGSVINLSLGGGASQALDKAVEGAVAAGVHVAVAAGNDNADACDTSPARSSAPITVGATNSKDEKASFSNWGKCVDVLAPGEDILSTYIWGDTATMSGTSMASPHIAGLLSYFLSLQPDSKSGFASSASVSPAVLKSKLTKYGTKGVITGIQDKQTPNILAYNGAGGNLTDFW